MPSKHEDKPPYRSNSQIKIIKVMAKPANPEDFHSKIKIIQKKAPGKQRKKTKKLPLAKKFQFHWFMKQEKNIAEMYNELLAQELLRLLMPYYPKTRRIVPTRGIKNFVMSKEIKGYQGLHQLKANEVAAKIIKGKYVGFGSALITAIFINDVDIRPENFCVDEESHIIKLDGGMAFTNLVKKNYSEREIQNGNYVVTVSDIESLPFLTHYQSYNWFKYEEYLNYFSEIGKSPHFRQEINESLLKICLLPDKLLREFVTFYLPENKYKNTREIYIHEILSRRDMLRQAAKKSLSFQQYFKTNAPALLLEEYIKSLYSFDLMHKKKLMSNENELAIREFYSKIETHFILREKKNMMLFKPVTRESSQPEEGYLQYCNIM